MPKPATTARGITPAGVFIATYKWSYRANPRLVWKALTTDINKWWQPDFFGSPSSKRYVFDAKLGGTMREEGSKGCGIIWGTVQALEPGKSVLVVGHTVPRFGGPNTGTMEFTVEPSKTGCNLTLTHAVFGNADAMTRASLEEGWDILFNKTMRKYLDA